MARPRKPIDGKQVERLAAIGCTVREVAAVLDCSVTTIDDRFREFFDKGRDSMKMRLRRAQIKTALGGNVVMLIFLGKNYLGQRDKIDVDVNDARQRAETAIKQVMDETGLTRDDAIAQLSTQIENIREYVN